MHNGSPTTITRRSIRQNLEELASAREAVSRGCQPVFRPSGFDHSVRLTSRMSSLAQYSSRFWLALDLKRYLGPSLTSRFLISGLSYKTTFSSELRISSFPLYSIWPDLRNLFMKKLTRDRVVPIISARVS
jgi:hypothetical protein